MTHYRVTVHAMTRDFGPWVIEAETAGDAERRAVLLAESEHEYRDLLREHRAAAGRGWKPSPTVQAQPIGNVVPPTCAGCGLPFVAARPPLTREGEHWHADCWALCTGEVVTRP